MALLEIDKLQVGFATEAGLVRAVDGVSIAVPMSRTVPSAPTSIGHGSFGITPVTRTRSPAFGSGAHA